MYSTAEEKVQRTARAIAARRCERRRLTLRRLRETDTSRIEDVTASTPLDLAGRIAQVRALLTTRKQ
jgi:hypothetical protein